MELELVIPRRDGINRHVFKNQAQHITIKHVWLTQTISKRSNTLRNQSHKISHINTPFF